ncbi:hypothetical protein VDGE_03471 [Verticillium dahliae]|uniref:Uncharacterized protein n=1 Tax=Verticillium dahliae TaxID=27337 RepID=A0A444RKL7_VERDA|nr:hypothetical protein VDGE_03471 [Verticillium dahliae]
MAVANQPWRRYGSTGEMLMELLKEANGWLRDSLIASGCTEAENSGGFNQTWSTKFAAINAFAERYLRSITTARLKARVAAILIHEQQDVAGDTEAPETNYDKLQTALKAVESLSRMAATDFLNMGRSDHMPDLRKRLSDIDGLVKDELSKKAEEIASTSAPEIDATSHDTAGVSQGPLEVDEAWLQPPDGAQKHCNATPERSREKATGNTEERRPHTPDVEVHTRKRELALLSPGPHSRPAKRPSREDLSESVDYSRQSVEGEDIWGEHKPDDGVEGEEADDLDLEGRARSVQAFSSIIAVPNSVSSTGRRTEKEIESSSSDWGTLKLLPGVRIVRKFQGNLRTHTPYKGPYYEIAICDSYKQRFLSHGFQLRAMKVQPDDWTVPSDIDVHVYGRRHAEQMVADCADEYTRYASKALESGLGPGLDEFYRRFAPAGLRVVVEWIIIMRQLLVFSTSFFLSCQPLTV